MDRVTQELRKWQQDCRTSQDSFSRLDYNFSKVEKENVKLRSTKDQYTDLLREHLALKQQVPALNRGMCAS